MNITQNHTRSAFTLVETITAMACGTIVLAALLAMSISLQRSFAAVEGYSIAEGDQLRVQDYIAMDCRRAVSANYDSVNKILTLTVPNYYTSIDCSSGSCIGGSPQAPYFDVNEKIQYGNAGTTTISYYQNGSGFMRQVGGSSAVCAPGVAWTNCAKAIATNVSTFTVTPVDQSNSKVSCSITFTPRFTSLPGPGPIEATTVYSQTFLRNAVARQ
jgi:hypothetical protein